MSLLLDALNRASKDKAAAAAVSSAVEPTQTSINLPPNPVPAVAPDHLPGNTREPNGLGSTMQLVTDPETLTLAAKPEPKVQRVAESTAATKTGSFNPTAATAGPQAAQAILRAKAPIAKTTGPRRLIALAAVAVLLAAGLGSVMLGWWGDPMAWFQSAGPQKPAGPAVVVARVIEPATMPIPVPLAAQAQAPASAASQNVIPIAPATVVALKPTAKPHASAALIEHKPASEPNAKEPPAARSANRPSQKPVPVKSAATLLQASAAPSALETGYAALTQGRLQDAQRAYNLALAGNPQERDALLGLAYIAHREGRVADAQDYYARVLRHEPGNPAARAGLLSLSTTDDPQALASRSREVAEQNPDSAAAQSLLGHSLARQGRLADARLAFARALQLEPDVALHAFNLAVALDRLHNYAQAQTYYQRALALSTQSGGEGASGVPHVTLQKRLEQLRGASMPAGSR